MKKLLILLTTIIILTGCNEKEVKEKNKVNTENKEQNQIEQPQQTYSLETEDLKKTIESTLNLDSVSLKMTGKAITQQSQIISEEETIIEMSNKGTLYKMSIPHEQQGISQTVYTEVNGSLMTVYMKVSNEWLKKTGEPESENQNNTFLDVLKVAKSFNKLESDIENKNKYEIIAKTSELMKALGEKTDNAKQEVDPDIKFTVYTDGKYVTEIILTMEEYNTKIEYTIEYYNHNNTFVELPEEVKNAKSYDQFMQEMLGKIEQKMLDEENN